jgi:uncharacterized protein (DUF3084 family)
MPNYTILTEDEKTAIRQNAIRNLEYGMYALEVDLESEKIKSELDDVRIDQIEKEIAEKEAQIAKLLS